MHHRLLVSRRLVLCLYGLLWTVWAPPSSAAISIGQPLKVRILYDNSGSMYPGYAPPGRPGTPKSDSGALFFHQYPEIQEWIADFVARQTILDVGTVSMSTFTSQGELASLDIRQVHPEVPVARFDVARAVRAFPSKVGQTTYLTESLDRFTHGFEGLVWLITDNIVETRAGEANADVERFFLALNDTPRYRSVHLFKYTFRDARSGQSSTLAIYGILVSEAGVPDPVLAYFDRKFRSNFRFANQRRGDPPPRLFPGSEHLKLKNLEIDVLELQAIPTLEVILDDPESGAFKEGQTVQLGLVGKIQSYLTQHSVIGGTYELAVEKPFEPIGGEAKSLGAPTLTPASFQSVHGAILEQEPIPPNGTRDVTAVLRTTQPVAFSGGGPGAWFRLATGGATVDYEGKVEMSFADIKVGFKRDQMAGIFGIDAASRIFDFQDVKTIKVAPSSATMKFKLKAGSSRSAIFLVLFIALVAVLGLAAVFLARKAWYHVRITGTPDRLIPLRRLGSYEIAHEGQPLGSLSRDLSGDYEFTANAGSAAFSITPASQPDTFDVRFRDGRGCQLSIEPQGGSTKPRKEGPAATGGPPSATGFSAPPPLPPPSLPKMDRP
jgi:hypothetical protein